MAGPGIGPDRSYNADVSMATSQFSVVVQGAADGSMKLPAAAGEGKILGILQDNPILGQQGKVRTGDFSTVVAAGTIARGDQVEIANAAGGVRKHSSNTNAIVGQAQQSAVTGDHFEIRINIIPLDVIHPAS